MEKGRIQVDMWAVQREWRQGWLHNVIAGEGGPMEQKGSAFSVGGCTRPMIGPSFPKLHDST